MINFELTCNRCSKFNQAAWPPRCMPSHNSYAQPDSPACHYFSRIEPVYLDLNSGPKSQGVNHVCTN